MDFKIANELLKKNRHLIGKTFNGARIEEIILIPTNPSTREKFIKLYLETQRGNKAIIPFIGVDVDIVAIFDKMRINSQSLLFETSIYNLPAELEVIKE